MRSVFSQDARESATARMATGDGGRRAGRWRKSVLRSREDDASAAGAIRASRERVSERARARASGVDGSLRDSVDAREVRFERAFDDVETRFDALKRRLEWPRSLGREGIASNARAGVREMFARARLHRDKTRQVRRAKNRKLSGNDAQRALRMWILDHFDDPFPTLAEKKQLAKKLGLKVAAVSNFFINARVRFWKPLVLQLAAEIERGD